MKAVPSIIPASRYHSANADSCRDVCEGMDDKLEVRREETVRLSPYLQSMQQEHHPVGGQQRGPPPPPEAYRAHANGQISMPQHAQLPPVQGVQQQAQYAAGPMNGAPMVQHPTSYPPPRYQYQNGAMLQINAHSSVVANEQNGVMRYALPPQNPMDARPMSGGRHKKEIKRRTKTGCLTCRKRRIKVSEYVRYFQMQTLEETWKARPRLIDGARDGYKRDFVCDLAVHTQADSQTVRRGATTVPQLPKE